MRKTEQLLPLTVHQFCAEAPGSIFYPDLNQAAGVLSLLMAAR
jgi:hypothetical protein